MSPVNSSSNSSCKLFVGGLSYDTTDASLSRYFEKYGELVSAVVLRDSETLRSRGFGFVTFTTSTAANDVLSSKRHVIDGREVETKLAVPRSGNGNFNSHSGSGSSSNRHSHSNSMSSKNGNFHHQNASSNVNQSQRSSSRNSGGSSYSNSLSSNTSVSSSVASTSIKNNISPRRRKNVEDKDSNTVSGQSQNNSKQNKKKPIIPNKIFVGGLLYATGHDSLRKYFENFGVVEMAEVIYNKDTKKSRGFGFVVFQDFDAVTAVLDLQESGRHVVDGKQVEVKLCVARQESSSMMNTKNYHDNTNSNHHNLNASVAKNKTHTDVKSRNFVKPKKSTAAPIAPTVNQWHQKSLIASFAQAVAIGTQHEKQPQAQMSDKNKNNVVDLDLDPSESEEMTSETKRQEFVGDFLPAATLQDATIDTPEPQPLSVNEHDHAFNENTVFTDSLFDHNKLANDKLNDWNHFNQDQDMVGYGGLNTHTPLGLNSFDVGVDVGQSHSHNHVEILSQGQTMVGREGPQGPRSPLARFMSPHSTPAGPSEGEFVYSEPILEFSLPPAHGDHVPVNVKFDQDSSVDVDNLFNNQNYQGFSMFNSPSPVHENVNMRFENN